MQENANVLDTSSGQSENETNVDVFHKPNKREQTQTDKRQGYKVRYSKESNEQKQEELAKRDKKMQNSICR